MARRKKTALFCCAVAFLWVLWQTEASPTVAAEAPKSVSAPMTIQIPESQGSRGHIVLDLSVQELSVSSQQSVGGVVWLSRPGRQPVEVGRFSFFPTGPFVANSPDDERTYRFDITNAVGQLDAKGKQTEVRVQLVDRLRGEGISDAEVKLGGAKVQVQ